VQLDALVHQLDRRAVEAPGIAQVPVSRDADGSVQREIERGRRQRPQPPALFGQPLGHDEPAGRVLAPVRNLIAPGV
jgi:hypothetical protein